MVINEEEKDTSTQFKLSVSILDPDKFVKANNFQEVTNPLYFIRDNIPSADGLLSNEIFGITKEERANIFAYINLNGIFIDPSCYKAWCRMDRRIKEIVHGTKKFKIIDGDFVEDPNGKCGVKFLKDNIDQIKIRSTGSSKRDDKIKYIYANKHNMFITKFMVIPPFYRDVNTTKGNIGVGAINKMYTSLIIATKALKDTADFGFSVDDANRGRIQEILVNIYDWFCGNRNDSVDQDAVGLSHKLGIIKRANLSKTTDYASRLVLSAPDLRVETLDDLMVTMEQSAVPLASICATFYPYMIFAIKRMFDDWFSGNSTIETITPKGKVERYRIVEPQIQFSDEVIKAELKRFIHGFGNRFIPVNAEVEPIFGDGPRKKVALRFKGYDNMHASNDDSGQSILVSRRMTWLDIFYMAACEVSEGKVILITRFPIDSKYNQFPTKIVVSSTKETEQIYYGETFYKWYPKIREEDIGTDTSNKFIDTLNICNLFLKAIVGDYDGDTASVKGCYTLESNEELIEHIHSKANYINSSGTNIREWSNEAVQCLYNLTKVLSGTKLDAVEF